MSTKIQYDSYGNSIDGTDYCSGVETFAQNLIEDNANDAAIIFPSPNGWVTPRSETYKFEDKNAQVILPEKIYSPPIVHILLSYENESKDLVEIYDRATNITYYLVNVVDNTGKQTNYIDVSNFVVSADTYGTLSTPITSEQASSSKPNKGNTFIYSDNKINIYNKTFSSWTTNSGNSMNWQIAVESAVRYKYSSFIVKDNRGNISTIQNIGSSDLYFVSVTTNDPRFLQFRVSYIPMSSDIKLRARKSVRQQEEYIQILNQRAEINSASALGKFMYNTAQKMGTEQITLVKFYTKIGDIPPLGCRVKHNGEHYILTANSLEMTNCVQVKVTHTLSKNWSNKSQYVSVDQKYRNYKIPADILWRNMLWEDHVVVSKQSYETEIENKGSLLAGKWLPHLYCNRNGDVTVTSLFLTRKDPVTQRNIGAVVPCTTLGPAKSIVFAGSMKDQLSAGLRINPSQPDYCEEVFYCDNNGKLKEGTITLADNIEHFDAAQYPYTEWSVQDGQEYYLNSPGYDVFRVTFSIDKDPGEALKFIYQCHFVEDDPDILIGDKLTETHHLIKKWPTDRKFRFWRLNRFLRQGVDKVYSQDGEYRQIDADTDREKYWTISIDQTDRSGTLTLQFHANNYLGAGNVGWAITDENNNLYIGCNDVSTRKLIFNFMHEWK